MKIAGTLQTGGICDRCYKQVGVGRVVLFERDDAPYPRFVCCASSAELEEIAIEIEAEGKCESAERTWALASAKCLDHNRAAHYANAAARCRRKVLPDRREDPVEVD